MSTKVSDLSAVWAGFLELHLRPHTEEYAKGFRGAFTTVLVRCETAEQFVSAAATHVDREGFKIVGIERLFPLACGRFEITDALQELIDRTHEYPVQWTAFHLFKDEAG